jgi:multidrug efflux pump subunit AcrA (membrane-fusion protein)
LLRVISKGWNGKQRKRRGGAPTLPAWQAGWNISFKSDAAIPPIQGRIEVIGPIVDPKTGMGLAMGYVDNPTGRLRAGQTVRLTVALPPVPFAVEIPAAAVVKDGDTSVVFVQPDPQKLAYARRRVSVAWRCKDVVHLRSRLNQEEELRGLKPIQPGERIVITGAAELWAALQTSKAKEKR